MTNVVKLGPMLTAFGQMLNQSRDRESLASPECMITSTDPIWCRRRNEVHTDFAEAWPNPEQLLPGETQARQNSLDFGRIRANGGWNRAKFGRTPIEPIRSKSPNVDQGWSKFGRGRAQIRSTSAEFVRTRADLRRDMFGLLRHNFARDRANFGGRVRSLPKFAADCNRHCLHTVEAEQNMANMAPTSAMSSTLQSNKVGFGCTRAKLAGSRAKLSRASGMSFASEPALADSGPNSEGSQR